jgi:hypothetical protein
MYAKTQRRLKLNTLLSIDFNLNSNVDFNQNLDFDDSNSIFIFVSFMFTLFFMRITSAIKRLTDDKTISRKIHKFKKKRKIIHLINQFYDNLSDNLCKKSYVLIKNQIKHIER